MLKSSSAQASMKRTITSGSSNFVKIVIAFFCRRTGCERKRRVPSGPATGGSGSYHSSTGDTMK